MEEIKWARDLLKQALKYPLAHPADHLGEAKVPVIPQAGGGRKRPTLTLKWQQLGKTEAHQLTLDATSKVGQVRTALSKLHGGVPVNLIVKGKALVEDDIELRDCWEEGQTIYVKVKRTVTLSEAFWSKLDEALAQEEALSAPMRTAFVEQLKAHHQDWLSK